MGAASGLPAYTDAWITLAGLARDTSTIRLGTLVTPVTFRPVGSFPTVVAEVDHMSHGRLDVGLGAGWYQEEHDAYGLPFPSASDRYGLAGSSPYSMGCGPRPWRHLGVHRCNLYGAP